MGGAIKGPLHEPAPPDASEDPGRVVREAGRLDCPRCTVTWPDRCSRCAEPLRLVLDCPPAPPPNDKIVKGFGAPWGTWPWRLALAAVVGLLLPWAYAAAVLIGAVYMAYCAAVLEAVGLALLGR